MEFSKQAWAVFVVGMATLAVAWTAQLPTNTFTMGSLVLVEVMSVIIFVWGMRFSRHYGQAMLGAIFLYGVIVQVARIAQKAGGIALR